MKRRRANECNFIKNKEYKYVLGKSMPPYTNLSLFLIINSKTYVSHQNILTTSAATVVFVRKVSHDSVFFKRWSIQLKLFHWHVMLRLCRFTNFSLLFVKLSLFSKIKLNSSCFICEQIIIIITILNFSFCGEFVNLDYIHWT